MSLVALGISGGIGAYKAVEVARGLQQSGHDVVAVMTRASRRFVGSVTLEAITRRRVVTDQFAPGVNADIEHIALATEIDLLLVAPATANIIGKFAAGVADDALSSLYVATAAPVLLAPAMNTRMLEHPAVQRNIATLAADGVHLVEPGEGYLACGWIGKGRLAEPDVVVRAAGALLRPSTALAGRRVVITAGPTYEDLDPVRYLGNRSSGRMGYALAAEARRRGAETQLIAGPSSLERPAGVAFVQVRSAEDMYQAVMTAGSAADVVVMAAAVADYRVTTGPAPQKIGKDRATLTLTLERTRDILAALGGARGESRRPVLVGFAAETSQVLDKARAKLAAKQVDMIVANDVSRADAGFEVETNVVTIVTRAGDEALPLQSKRDVAGVLLDRIETLLLRAGVEPAAAEHP